MVRICRGGLRRIDSGVEQAGSGFQYERGRFPKMLAKQRAGFDRIALQGRLHQVFVLLKSIALVILFTDGVLPKEAITFGVLIHQLAEVEEPFGLARRDQRGVKVIVGDPQYSLLAHGYVSQATRTTSQSMKGSHDARLPSEIAVLDGALQRDAFDRDTRLRNIDELFTTGGRGSKPALVHGLNEPIGHQP